MQNKSDFQDTTYDIKTKSAASSKWLLASFVALLLCCLSCLAMVIQTLLSSSNHEERCAQLRQDAQAALCRSDLSSAESSLLLAEKEAAASPNLLQSPAVSRDLARVYRLKGKAADEERCLRKALDKYGELSNSKFNDGAAFHTTLISGTVDCLHELANSLRDRGELHESCNLYEEALKADQESEVVNSNIREDYVKTLEKVHSESSKRRAIELQAANQYLGDFNTYSKSIERKVKERDFDGLIQQLKAAEVSASRSGQTNDQEKALSSLCTSYIICHRGAEAVDSIERALRIIMKQGDKACLPIALALLARSYEEEEKLDKAVLTYKAAMNANASVTIWSLINLASAQDPKGAEVTYERMLKLVQQFPTANYHCSTELLSAKCWRFLGNSYCIDKRNAEAKNAYTHAYRLLLRAKDGASTIAPELIATAFGLEQLHDPAAKIVREKAKTLVGVEAYNQLLKH